MARPRTAVVLFNLGGPDGPEAIRPFLFNLFNDPAIIRRPAPLRWLVAQTISRLRTPSARRMYGRIGGASPLLSLTRSQAEHLAAALGEDARARIFVAMRYWHPLAADCAAEVAAFAPDRVVLLPLYPQFSTTTTGSFLRVWNQAAAAAGIRAPTTTICCYPTEPGLIAAIAALTGKAVADAAAGGGRPQVLFSAHGLPETVVAAGDPYPDQVAATVAAVVARLGGEGFDHLICYQSRVGPVEWLRPYTEDEIVRAAAARRPLVVVPVAFVSEHVETLVELDIDYARLAAAHGAPAYVRVPAVGTAPAFIAGLARLVRRAADGETPLMSQRGARICAPARTGCAFASGPAGGVGG